MKAACFRTVLPKWMTDLSQPAEEHETAANLPKPSPQEVPRGHETASPFLYELWAEMTG